MKALVLTLMAMALFDLMMAGVLHSAG